MISKMLLYLVLLSQNSTYALAGTLEETNKKIVREFYEMAFVHHLPKDAAEKYLAPTYIQHNPNVETGRQPFIDFFVPFFKSNPNARADIKRVIAEGDLVVLHVHSKAGKDDRGRAVVDIFRVENGKILEHWDVMQAVPEKAAHKNTMF